ncbi:MAG TPA: PQQ-binding-like beta-propeller repeat protein [Rhizomicrobium sp.]|nr:PQQ-binding-like beta-propeller repeat protein [Rhizomicrobium sp.]
MRLSTGVTSSWLLRTSALIAMGLCAISGGAFAHEITSLGYLADAAHKSQVDADHLVPPLKLKWSRDLGVYASYPIVKDGLVFITAGDATVCNNVTELMALDLKTGDTVWQHDISSLYCWSNAAYTDGHLAVITTNGQISGFSADRTGQQLWSTQLPVQYLFYTPPTGYKGQIFVGGGGYSGTVYAVDAANGNLNWMANIEGDGASPPAIGDGGVYVSYPCQSYKFDILTGEQKWRYQNGCEGGGGAPPIYLKHRVYTNDGFSNFVVLDSRTGLPIGHRPADQPSAVWTDSNGKDFLMVVLDGTLRCLSLPKGQLQWTFSAGADNYVSSAPLVIGNTVAIASFNDIHHNGAIFMLDAATGNELWSGDLYTGFEQPYAGPINGLGAGRDTLLVPSGYLISAYVSKHRH